MCNFKKHWYLPVLFSLSLMLSCKKKHLSETASIPEIKQPEQLFVPVKLEGPDLSITLTYKENTTLLTGIESTGGNKITITYTNKLQPYKLEKYKNNQLYYVAYYKSTADQPTIAADQFDYNPVLQNYTPIGSYSLVYNDSQQLTEVKYYNSNSQGNLIGSMVLSYIDGTLSASTLTNSNRQSNHLKYSFDNKKGIALHIAEARLLTLEADFWFLHCSRYNILSCADLQRPVESTSFSYAYNEEGYPSTMTIITGKTTQVMKITYKVWTPPIGSTFAP